jgi:hypothetical protein
MSVTITNHESADQKVGESLAIIPRWCAWTIVHFESVLASRDIEFTVSPDLSSVEGLVIQCGETQVLIVQAALSEQKKIAAVAHELGHIALGDMSIERFSHHGFRRTTSGALVGILQDVGREHLADMWAAHLLVRPYVYEWCLEQAQWRFPGNKSRIASEAIKLTADSLNIPDYVVSLWLQTRAREFSLSPYEWYAQSLARDHMDSPNLGISEEI